MLEYAVASLLAGLVVGAPGPSVAESTKVAFATGVKKGDVFDYRRNEVSVMDFSGPKIKVRVTSKDTRAAVQTVDSAERGWPRRVTRKYGKHYVAQTYHGIADKPIERGGNGLYEGVTIGFEYRNGAYAQAVLSGAVSEALKTALADPQKYVFGEDALPTGSLAVGDKQVIRDPRWLASMFGGFSGRRFLEPLTYELISFNDGIATIRGRSRLAATVSVPNGPSVSMEIEVTLTTTFDANAHHVRESVIEAKAVGSQDELRAAFDLEISTTLNRR